VSWKPDPEPPPYLRTLSSRNREWLDVDGSFLFGRYKGKTVEQVRREDPGYLHWILDSVEDICAGDQEIIEAALAWRRK